MSEIKETELNVGGEIIIPVNPCPGCAARDRIINTLAERIDELDGGQLGANVKTTFEAEAA